MYVAPNCAGTERTVGWGPRRGIKNGPDSPSLLGASRMLGTETKVYTTVVGSMVRFICWTMWVGLYCLPGNVCTYAAGCENKGAP